MMTMEWRLIIALDNVPAHITATIEEEIETATDYLTKMDDNSAQDVHRDYWVRRLHRARRLLRQTPTASGFPEDRPLSRHGDGQRRERRGALDFIGAVSKSLFGTATDADVRLVHDAVVENRRTLNGIIHRENLKLTLYNATCAQIQENRHALNELVNTSAVLRDAFKSFTTRLVSSVNARVLYNRISENVATIFYHIHAYRSNRSKTCGVWP